MAGSNNSLFVFNPLLTQMSIKRGLGERGTSVALAPIVDSQSINGVYNVRDRQRVGSTDPKRAPGEKVKMAETSRNSLKPFLTIDRSIIKHVPLEMVDGQGEAQLFDELANASDEALEEIQQAHMEDVNSLLWAANLAGFQSIYGTGDQVITPTTKWDQAGATIKGNVDTVKNAVYKRCGKKPNTIGITKGLFDIITSDPNNELGERIKYTDGTVPTAARLATYFGVEQVLVFEELQDTANPGQADNFDYLYDGNHVLVAYINPANTRNKVTLASTFVWQNARRPFLGVFTRYNEDFERYEAKVGAYYDEQIVEVTAGGAIADAI